MNEHEQTTIPEETKLAPEGEADPNPNEEHAAESGEEKLVPMAEARKYRKRAQAAEKILEDLKQELAQGKSLLQEREQLIDDLERSRRIDELLVESDAIDLEAARLLTEMAVAEMDEPDVEMAVSELRRRKPYLFTRRSRQTGTLSPHSNGSALEYESLDHAAAEAGATGSRADLLRYLRLRRKK